MQGLFYKKSPKKVVVPTKRIKKPIRVRKESGFISSSNSCDKCGLNKKAKHPDIPVCGDGKLGVMLAGQSPGYNEDERGENFVGNSGDLIKKYLCNDGFDFLEDFWTINSFRCRPQSKTNYLMYQKCCYQKFDDDIKKLKPWLIVAMGKEAIQSTFGIFHPISMGQFQDLLIPHVKYNCWVYCTYHPAYILRNIRDNESLFVDFIVRVKELIRDKEEGLEFEWRRRTDWQLDNVETIYDFDKAVEYLRFLRTVDKFAFDWENFPLKPFTKDAKVLCGGFATDGNHGKCIPIDKTPMPKRKPYWSPRQRRILIGELKETLETEDVLKINHNTQHEILWAKFLGIEVAPPWTCTMVRQHLRWEKKGAGKSGWYGPKSLKYQMFVRRGLWPYDEHLNPPNMNFDLLPDEQLFPYCSYDAKSAYWLYEEQESEGYENIDLAEDIHINHGCKAMVEMTWQGIDVNRSAAENLESEWQVQIINLKGFLLNHDLAKEWKKINKVEVDLNSGKQVGKLLFDIGKLPGGKKTSKSGQWATTDEVLIGLKNNGYEWPAKWAEYKKLEKNVGTFVQGYIFDCLGSDGKLHPSLNLAVAETFRSSANDPNIQNFPIRSEIGKEVRKVIIAPRGWKIREYDFGQHEVRIAAMLSKDELLIEHIVGGHDFHREYAARVLDKFESRVIKDERQGAGKNGFVFAKIYGSGWSNIYENLVAKGYRVTEKTVKKAYYHFEDVYCGLTEYQQSLVDFCRANGYIETPLGYRRHEPLKYTEIVNFPVQNIAFVLLLYGVSIAMIELKKRSMRSKGIFQVHDSSDFIHPIEEEKELDRIVKSSCLHFPWEFTKTIPLELECKSGSNWLDMKEVELWD